MADTCTATTRLTLSPYDHDHPDVRCMREVDAEGRHVGQHQGIDHVPFKAGDTTSEWKWMQEDREAYDRLVDWSQGGASSRAYDPAIPNQNCMCVQATARGDTHQLNALGHGPEDHRWNTCASCGIIHDTTRPGETWCSSCGIWLRRAQAFAEGPVLTGRDKGARHVRFHGDEFSQGQPRLYGWSPGSQGAFGGMVVTVTMDDGTVLGPSDSLWDNGAIPWWLLDRFPPNARVQRGDKVARPGHTDAFGKPLAYTAHPEVSRG